MPTTRDTTRYLTASASLCSWRLTDNGYLTWIRSHRLYSGERRRMTRTPASINSGVLGYALTFTHKGGHI